MTNEELCLRYQAGDAGAAEELISRNMGLIRSIAIRYAHDYSMKHRMILCRQAPFWMYLITASTNRDTWSGESK